MAATAFSLTTSVVLASLGYALGSEVTLRECTEESVLKCGDRTYNVDFCRKYKVFKGCVDELDGNCPDHVEELKQMILDWRRSSAVVCKGMAEGECYSTAEDKCWEHIPFDISFYDILDEQKEELCVEYTRKFNLFIPCMQNLIDTCEENDHSQELVDWAVEELKVCD